MTTFPSFARRRNQNSSIDSICTKCFLTIASAGAEEELAAHEENHVCDPFGKFGSMRFDPESRAHGVRRPHRNIQAS
jgi:hypothetical protein